jgi:hypothetical protein
MIFLKPAESSDELALFMSQNARQKNLAGNVHP